MFTQPQADVRRRQMLNKVPEVTLYFWVIKVLCTTVGESAADFLNVNLGFGLTGTSLVTGILLVVALAAQFRMTRYVPGVYWLTVALVSVFGTLVTDNLTDGMSVPLETSTLIFASLLGLTFVVWYNAEKTISIHSITTPRREAFYWTAILFTFALGTATGDLMAETLGLGYLATGLIVTGLIAVTAVAWKLGLNSVLSFWIIYILTRPLGASAGDLLSQPSEFGGLGLGATVTSAIFVVAILAVVIYLSFTKADAAPVDVPEPEPGVVEKGGLLQTIVVVVLLVVVGGSAYKVRLNTLESEANASTTAIAADGTAASPLGDLSQFSVITQDTLDFVNAGEQSKATSRIGDLEVAWDNAQARLKIKDKAAWNEIDGRIDTALRETRASSPNTDDEKAALAALIVALH